MAEMAAVTGVPVIEHQYVSGTALSIVDIHFDEEQGHRLEDT